MGRSPKSKGVGADSDRFEARIFASVVNIKEGRL